MSDTEGPIISRIRVTPRELQLYQLCVHLSIPQVRPTEFQQHYCEYLASTNKNTRDSLGQVCRYRTSIQSLTNNATVSTWWVIG